MRKLMSIAAVAALVLLFGGTDLFAAGPKGPVMEEYSYSYSYLYHFFYQWMRDDDGDGIPNCLDPDFVKPGDGTGNAYKKGEENGDGEGAKTRIRTRTNDGQGHLHRYVYERTEYKHKGGE